MAITRSGESGLALQLEFIRTSRPPERRKEFGWLLGASLLVAAGLGLVLAAKTENFGAAQQRVASGELFNLNAPAAPEQTARMLQGVFGNAADRELAGNRLASYLTQHRPLGNVGALAHLRLSRTEIENDDRWANWRPGLLPDQPKDSKTIVSVPLLPVAKLKSFVAVRTPQDFLRVFAKWTLLYFAAFWVVHLAWRWRKFRGDPAILPAIHLLTGIGLISIVSMRDPLRDTLEFQKFAWGTVLGCALLLLPLIRAFQYHRFSRWIYTPLITALILFVALLRFGSGPTGSDARVNLGPFQPVEIIKILLVFFMAGYFSSNWERLRDLHQKTLVPKSLRWLELPRIRHALPVMYAVFCALASFFVLKDMGPALVTGVLFVVMFAIARRRSGLALLGFALLCGGVAIGYHYGAPHTVAERVSMWLSPWDNDIRGGDQLAHSLWAFATGGPWGSGPGWGDPGVIPAGHTDLILPAVAEEWGFPGAASICLLFALLVARSFHIARRAADEYAMFLAAGLGTLIALEMLLISGGVLGAIPLSGVVSPFLSSGNTAMLANFLIFSILLGISNQSARSELAPAGTDDIAAGLDPIFGRPLRIVAAGLGLCAVALLAKAALIELWHDRELLAKDALVFTSDGVKRPQHNPRLNLLAAAIPRGDIYDRNGVLLATSSWTKLTEHRADYARLGISIDQNGSAVDTRHYPFGSATLHLLGDFRTGERFHASNASLVEHDSNKRLQGYDELHDLAPLVRYRHQMENPDLAALLNRNRDVRATIDIRLQLKATEILQKHLERSSKKGALIVLDAETGDVLTMVSWPAPQSDGQSTPDELLDRARYGEYPPGSTFKLVTAMAALRLNPFAMRQTYSCRRLSDGRTGTIIPGWRRPIRDDIRDRVHGTLNMANAITVSCNAYFAQLGVFNVGSKALLETAKELGINAGTEAQIKQMLPFAAYGQGPVVITPLKMARVAATVAAGGLMPEGRWVLDSSNERTDAPLRVISPESAAFLMNAMRSVVTTGTARTAMANFAIPVAGKTGTAQLDSGEPHSWFAGFAPFDAPSDRRIAFAVVVEHGGYGATVAAPIARDLVEAAEQLGILNASGRR